MFHRFHYNVPHYFVMKLNLELKELFVSFGLIELATYAVMIFEPIYLFSLGYDLKHIMAYYLVVYGLYVMLLPLGGSVAAWFGSERTILAASFFLIGYYASLFALPGEPALFWVAPVIFALQKILYWPAYHADFARFSDRIQRGKEVSGILTLDSFLATVAPFIGGAVVTLFGFRSLFGLVIILILFSNLPLLAVRSRVPRERRHPAYFWSFLVAREQRRKFFAYMGFGEELIVLVVWPIFIYTILHGIFAVGSLVAIAGAITAIVTLYIGKLTDQLHRHSIIRVGTAFAVLAWLWRTVARTSWQLLPLDALSRLSKNVIVVPLMAKTYDAANRGDQLRYAVFFEQSLAIGKFAAALAVLLLMPYASGFTVAFLVGAVFAALYALR